MKVIDSSHKGISVKNLSLHLAANEEVAHSLLFQGSANRKVAETSMNLQSSRSHAIFSILLTVKSPDTDVVTKWVVLLCMLVLHGKHMYVYMYVCTYVHMYVCTYICM